MNAHEWKSFAVGMVDRLSRQLPSSAPKKAQLQLAELRERACKPTTARMRKSWERSCDRLTESAPYFRGAARRVIGDLADIAIDGAEHCLSSMAGLARARGNKEAEKGIKKTLRDFRKKRRKPIYKPIKSVQRTRLRRVADLTR